MRPKPDMRAWRRLLRLLGVETSPERRFHIVLRPRLFYFIFALLALIIGSLGGMSYYSTRPGFCNSCHIMTPYYKAWKTSSHNFVSCVECHYPPGSAKTFLWHKFQALSQVAKYVTRTYSSKPYAEIEDASCLRDGCHSTRLLQGRVVSESGILFNHEPHLKSARYGRQLQCVSCHSQIVVGNHMEVTWDTCYLCHFKGHEGERGPEPMGGCQGCHLLPEKQINIANITVTHKDLVSYGTLYGQVDCQSCHRDAQKGEGEVGKDRCFVCHNEPEKLDRFVEKQFIHDFHVTEHQAACFHCHQPIRHGLTIRNEASALISECSKCHSSVHDLEGNLYSGVGARGVPEMPSPMFLARVDCVGCHLERKPTANLTSHAATYMGSEIGCRNCHGEEYLGMMVDGQEMVDETVAALSVNLEAVESTMVSNPLREEVAAKIEEKLTDAAYNLRLVGSAYSAHNIYYVANALQYSEMIISAAARKLEIEGLDKTSTMPIISGGYCASLCHDRLGVDVPGEGITFQGKEVAHGVHVKEGLSCKVCHDFGMHKEVEFKGEKTCRRCHSEEQLQ
jgi:hypothetical protein